MRKRRRTALGTLVLAPLLGITTGCATEPLEPVQQVPPPRAAAPDAPVDGCPVLAPEADGPTTSHTAIDYVDFLNHDGRQYLAGNADEAPVSSADLGEVVLTSRCSFSAFNERTGRDPGRPRDGDTAFLPPGTAVHAVDGWARECRLAAERDGQVYVYLALAPNTERAQPASCALDRATALSPPKVLQTGRHG